MPRPKRPFPEDAGSDTVSLSLEELKRTRNHIRNVKTRERRKRKRLVERDLQHQTDGQADLELASFSISQLKTSALIRQALKAKAAKSLARPPKKTPRPPQLPTAMEPLLAAKGSHPMLLRRRIHPKYVALTPWFSKNNIQRDRLGQLHREIADFEAWIRPTEEERYARHLVMQRLELVLQKVFGENKHVFTLHPFGSYDADLYLPTSDMDVVIVLNGSKDVLSAMASASGSAGGSAAGNVLKRLTRQLFRMPTLVDPKSIKYIRHARVPIVKYIDRSTGFEVDVSANVGSGLDGTKMIRKYVQEWPALRPLALVLKHFLALRELNEVFTGGLGSYALCCLLVSFFQHRGRQTAKTDEGLGELLLDFLETYGVLFDYGRFGISLRNGGRYFLRSKHPAFDENANNLSLCIEDPQNPQNDVSRGSYCFEQVRDSFKHAFHALMSTLALDMGSEDADGEDDLQSASVLGCIVWSTQPIERQREYIKRHTSVLK